MTKRAKQRILFIILGGIAVVAAAGACAIVWIGSALAAAVPCAVGEPPADLSAEAVSFDSESGSTLRGWFVAGEPGRGAVVLMHAIRGNRRSMVGRARFLHHLGYSVLLFDFQAHGESTGKRITFGYLESKDARAAVQFVRSRLPQERVAAVGTSLGGAACLLGDSPLDVDGLVLEAVYPEVRAAISDRLRIYLGPVGTFLTPLLTCQIKPRLGVSAEALRPIRHIGEVRCPVLVIAGTRDMRTTIQESRDLYAAAPMPKEIWEVEGAAHVDFHRYAGAEYEKRVGAFLASCLRGGTG